MPLYNSVAKVVNCRGLGTCGTCAVAVAPAEPLVGAEISFAPGGCDKAEPSPLAKASWRERTRLSLPPHSAANTAEHQLRLACQCRFENNNPPPATELVVTKHGGIWGHRLPITSGRGDVTGVHTNVLGSEAHLDMCAIHAAISLSLSLPLSLSLSHSHTQSLSLSLSHTHTHTLSHTHTHTHTLNVSRLTVRMKSLWDCVGEECP